MSNQTKARFAVDLDDLERQLRVTAGTQPKIQSSDPLAELARIVGQDDPFKAMFADKRALAPAGSAPSVPAPPVYAPAGAPLTGGRIEPSLDALLRDLDARSAPRPAAAAPMAAAPVTPVASSATPSQDMLDEFDRLLQSELRGTAGPSASAQAGTGHSIADVHELRTDDLMASPFEPETETVPRHDGTATGPRDLDADDAGARHHEPDLSARHPDETFTDASRTGYAAQDDYPEPPTGPQEDMRSLEPQQPRKGLVIACVLLGVAALGIGAIVGLRGMSGPSGGAGSGEVPIVRAETGPAKVQPQNPGGVEIPNQNKQIYERTPEPKPADTRVVTREEQPMDVQATARAAARVILPPPGTPASSTPAVEPSGTPANGNGGQLASVPPAGTNPQAANPQAALGEPRRVRTISVRPDGTIAPSPGSTMVASLPPVAPTAPAPRPVVAPPVSSQPVSSEPVSSQPAPAQTVATAPRAAPPRPAAPAPTPAAPERVQTAAASPSAPVSLRPAAAPAAAPAATGSGFMVQLGAPGSEAEARSSFASLQRRYADQLAGESPTIRRADLGNGRTVYRLRVGPFSSEDAAQKCEALKAAGGQCFVARN
ncbi:MAG: SPOR domain-containing protein [Hyphomicrobiales bacterium]|nr:SPOR domain-containing protein [Hyphomicrobiales bacterium]